MINPLDNTDDSHDPFFSSPDEFDQTQEDILFPESDFDPDFYEDPYWGED